ncbi:MAG: BatA domain-containing protein [Thermoguttaceae bacterium]|nr:BatA domain-containing protein [Thermoguttaceae bacterium]
MTLTTFSLFVAGLAATSIPIAIHLLSKGKPKRVAFPALRFVRANLATSRRKLGLKRFFLLLLRVLTLCALGLALARPYLAPSVPKGGSDSASGASANLDGRDRPVATLIVVDSSVRMGRVVENRSLFERAKDAALAVLDQTPKGSEIAILDGNLDGDAFLSDRVAAKTRLEKLEIAPTGRPVARTLLEAAALAKKAKSFEREIFVISDMTSPGWSDRDLKRLRREFSPDESSDANLPVLYFLDLGNDDYRDAAIVDLALSAETLPTGSTLRVDLDLERVGAEPEELVVETILFDSKALPANLESPEIFTDPKLATQKEFRAVEFPGEKSRRSIYFQLSNLPEGSYVGAVRILGGDALAIDDVRWFAVDVVPEWRSLVVAPEPVEDKALFLTQALAPEELRKTGRAPFELDLATYAKEKGDRGANLDLASASLESLERYKAIFLLDPGPLDEPTLDKLTTYVERGGGLGVFLGRRANPIKEFASPKAIRLLGCSPTKRVDAPNWDRELRPVDYDAPILAEFRPFERQGIPWDAAPIARYWKLEELADSTSLVATFAPIGDADSKAERDPALLENRLGRGLVATLATPVSDSEREEPWNALVSGDAPWVFVLFADSLARRLAFGTSSVLNYSTSEVAIVRAELDPFPPLATIVAPNGEEIPLSTDVERRQIKFSGANRPGVYRVRTPPGKNGAALDKPFAVSVRASEFDLSRRPEDKWTELWDGVSRKVLDPRETIKALDSERRAKNSEPYVAIVVLLAILFLFETFVADRFYAPTRRPNGES